MILKCTLIEKCGHHSSLTRVSPVERVSVALTIPRHCKKFCFQSIPLFSSAWPVVLKVTARNSQNFGQIPARKGPQDQARRIQRTRTRTTPRSKPNRGLRRILATEPSGAQVAHGCRSAQNVLVDSMELRRLSFLKSWWRADAASAALSPPNFKSHHEHHSSSHREEACGLYRCVAWPVRSCALLRGMALWDTRTDPRV
eukprot:scaffold3438_cov243-Pinguiococcus_pyrenoidosus.AAC.1